MNVPGAAMAGVAFFALTQAFNGIAPVTVWMKMHEQTRDGEAVIGRVTGYKIKDCAVVPDTFIGWQKLDGLWLETPFRFIDDPSPNSTHPSTWAAQDFGFWEWPSVASESSAVKMTLLHNCDGKLTVTQMPFHLEATP